MRLFEVVPGKFFSVLSSGNREIYYDALMILHDMFKYELNIRADDYIAQLITILDDRSFDLSVQYCIINLRKNRSERLPLG